MLDQTAQNSGTTAAAPPLCPPARRPPRRPPANWRSVFYVDSGFSDTLTAGSGLTSRVNVGKVGDMEMLAEEQSLGSAGATPNASVGTGANTIWLVATVVFKHS